MRMPNCQVQAVSHTMDINTVNSGQQKKACGVFG